MQPSGLPQVSGGRMWCRRYDWSHNWANNRLRTLLLPHSYLFLHSYLISCLILYWILILSNLYKTFKVSISIKKVRKVVDNLMITELLYGTIISYGMSFLWINFNPTWPKFLPFHGQIVGTSVIRSTGSKNVLLIRIMPMNAAPWPLNRLNIIYI